jgi:hypothetical protein
MLDVLDAVPEPAASKILVLGLSSSHGAVRIVGLERLGERAGIDAALPLAAADPDAKIRNWAAKRARPVASPSQATPPTEQGHQVSLFDLD